MRVLHVITGLGIGGAEQQLRLLLRHLPVQGRVVTLTNPGPVAVGIEADGTPVTHLGMTGNRDLGALPRLARLVREGGYDLVHTHLYRACVYGRLAARLGGVRRVIATEHSLGASQIEGRPLSAGTRALYLASERLGTSTVAVSASVARRLADWGVAPDRIEVVPNGIETGRFAFVPRARRLTRGVLGIPEDAFVVGGVGRLAPGKRFDRLIRAVASVPEARLLLVGDGERREELRAVARECGAAGRVHFFGACEDPPADGPAGPMLPELLAAMDVFVSTSPDETFGLAVVEALAAGLPVLYVACPAIEDLPADAAPGARRIGESVPELIGALRELRTAHGPGRPGRLPVPAAARRYDIARSADRLMTLYERAVERRPGP